jgi:glycosyltransferase involved in cell wall biosynthesis
MSLRQTVSIVVVTHNRAFLLRRCLDSIFAIPSECIEIIVVDDGSTDETPEVAGSFGSKINYVRKDNGGVATARNAGCRKATGRYVAFVDDDDMLHPERLSRLSEVMREHPETVCAFCQGVEVDQQGKETDRIVWKNLPTASEPVAVQDGYTRMVRAEITLTPLNTLVRKDAGDAIGWFDENLVHGCEDTDFFMRLSDKGPMVYVPEILTLVGRMAPVSLTKDVVRMAFSKLQLLERHRRLNRASSYHDNVRILKQRQYHFLRILCDERTATRELEKAYGIRLSTIAARLHPLQLLYLLYRRFLKRSVDETM